MRHLQKLFPLLIAILIGFLVAYRGVKFPDITVLDVILFLLFIYVGIYIHEFGHAVFGLLAGIQIKRITIGTGSKTILWRRRCANDFGYPFALGSSCC